MLSKERIYESFDLLALGLLPDDWKEQIEKTVENCAQQTILDGRSSTSREPVGSEPVEVFVVSGVDIKEQLPWLYNLYISQLNTFASNAAGHLVFPSQDLQSSVNINMLRGKGSRYEWHVDSNPLTGLLFVTNHGEEDGGELVFQKGNEQVVIHPKSGTFIAFDARELPHTVLPLKSGGTRISVPMNYYYSSETQDRPSDLDSYLYENND